MEIICPCSKKFEENNPKRIGRTKYCSKSCFYVYRKKRSGFKRIDLKPNPNWFRKGSTPHNKGLPSPLIKPNAGYDAIHEWVSRWAIDPGCCELCNSTKNLEWSNKSGKYLRDLIDWQRLCKKCHCKYDFEKFGARKVFYK